MKREWLRHTVLRVASLLAPGDQRAEWLKEWRSELWYIPRCRATRFCLGAFRDALWMRRNNPVPVKRTLVHLESPLNCLAFLATLAGVSVLIASRLPAPHAFPTLHLRARDLPAGCIPMLMLSCLLLPATRLAIGRPPGNCHPTSWPGRLRRGIFLALKITLVQPIMLCGFFVLIWMGPIPFAPQLGVCAYWILALRWVLLDQRRRCPVCLRLLTNPVRIGAPSETFLEWYGAESMCSRGHGLLHTSEFSASYSRNAQWLRLDGSWSGLFPSAPGGANHDA